MKELINASGTVRFNYAKEVIGISIGAEPVYLGKGFLVITIDGQQRRCEAQDISRCTMKAGTLTLMLKDGRAGLFGIGSKGVCTIPYAQLGNGQLFITLLQQWSGIPITAG